MPPFLMAHGLPSPPSNPGIRFSCPSQQCVLNVTWSPSLDSGVGVNSGQPLPLNYSLRIADTQTLAPSQTCPDFASIASFTNMLDSIAATTAFVAGLQKGKVYCVYLRAQNINLLYSAPAVLTVRPISPPQSPTQLSLLLNPADLTGFPAGTVPGSVVWMPPTDAGAGASVPVTLAASALQLYPCAGAGAGDNATTAGLSYPYNFTLGCAYVVRVAASNTQPASLGAFSAWGTYQSLSVYICKVGAGGRRLRAIGGGGDFMEVSQEGAGVVVWRGRCDMWWWWWGGGGSRRP